MKKLWLSNLLIFSVIIILLQAWATQAISNDYVISVDASAHQKFGLYYPATYKFSIPSGANGLIAQFKYSHSDDWSTLLEKNSSDTFNGV